MYLPQSLCQCEVYDKSINTQRIHSQKQYTLIIHSIFSFAVELTELICKLYFIIYQATIV